MNRLSTRKKVCKKNALVFKKTHTHTRVFEIFLFAICGDMSDLQHAENRTVGITVELLRTPGAKGHQGLRTPGAKGHQGLRTPGAKRPGN